MQRTLLIAFFTLITAVAVYVAIELHQSSKTSKIYKYDYFTVNQIKYGLLSGDKWTIQVNNIIVSHIDSFNFSGENKAVLQKQINGILNRLFTEVDAVLHKKQEKTIDKIKFKVIN